MVSFAIAIAAAMAAIAVICVLCAVAAAGFRDGDRPADATVTARLRDAGQPGEPRPVLVATVRNPSGTPVLAGLSARRARAPGWLGGGHAVTVPARTATRTAARRGLRPTGCACVGVVAAYGSACFTVPVRAPARRYLLMAAVGQAGGRLRLHRLHVTGAHGPARTRLTVPSGEFFPD